MAKSDDPFWRRFDEVERQRRQLSQRREDAFRRLSPEKGKAGDAEAQALWQQYCESIEQLEHSVAELERLLWRLK
jgi:type II secretory pathway component PulL